MYPALWEMMYPLREYDVRLRAHRIMYQIQNDAFGIVLNWRIFNFLFLPAYIYAE